MPAIAPVVRAGDPDREKTADLLGQALAQGYLEMPEYEARLQAAFAATTRRNCTSSQPTCPSNSSGATIPAAGRLAGGRHGEASRSTWPAIWRWSRSC